MSITSQAEDYIRSHASVSRCLHKGIINYSALARLILHETGMAASEESVIAAARRMRKKSKEHDPDKAAHLFKASNIDIKNNILSITLDKPAIPEPLIEIERAIRKENGLFFAIEGTKTVTIITQEHFLQLMKRFVGAAAKTDQVLISISTDGIAKIPGAVAFISGRFAEAGINIDEFMSCNDDTLIVIDKKDIQKAIGVLSF